MKKHIAAPATLDQIRQTLGITKEDEEVVDRMLMELEHAEAEPHDTSLDGNPEFDSQSRLTDEVFQPDMFRQLVLAAAKLAKQQNLIE